eukprot:g4324.t1
MLTFSEASNTLLKDVARAAVRHTVWPHFCAGPRLDDCKRVLDSVAPLGVSLIVDESVEERERPEDWADNLDKKKRLLRRCAETLGSGVAFVPVKVTALASPRLLEVMTSIIVSEEDYFDRIDEDVEDRLDEDDRRMLHVALEHLGDLCEEAKKIPGLSLALDAEQSHRQPAIDYIANCLMERYNKDDAPTTNERVRPVLYNTIQCYMTGSGRRLRRDLHLAKSGGYGYGVKLVRGAYLTSERARAAESRSLFPLRPSKADTDAAYDRILENTLVEVAKRTKASPTSSDIGLLVATHNVKSVDVATRAMDSLSIPKSFSGIHFATIMGMSDHLTIGLGLSGYNALKLVLFGEFEEIYPWLLRRLEENRDVLGGAHDERGLLVNEIRGRLFGR